MRAAMNAIFYLLRAGCPWRYLPRDSFTPRSTVHNIFRKIGRSRCQARAPAVGLVSGPLTEARGYDGVAPKAGVPATRIECVQPTQSACLAPRPRTIRLGFEERSEAGLFF